LKKVGRSSRLDLVGLKPFCCRAPLFFVVDTVRYTWIKEMVD